MNQKDRKHGSTAGRSKGDGGGGGQGEETVLLDGVARLARMPAAASRAEAGRRGRAQRERERQQQRDEARALLERELTAQMDEAAAAGAGRVWALGRQVAALWTANEGRIARATPRYVDGLPAREALAPPVFLPPRAARPRGEDGGGAGAACLQCRLKGLPCSRATTTKMTTTNATTAAAAPFRRCERNGEEACLDDGAQTTDEGASRGRGDATRGRLEAAVRERGN